MQHKFDYKCDGVVGTQTWGSRLEGAHESIELLRHPIPILEFKCCDLANWQNTYLHDLNDKEVRNMQLQSHKVTMENLGTIIA